MSVERSKEKMQFIFASNNSHKKKEFDNLCVNSSLSLVSSTRKITVVEDGEHYTDNALLKAKKYFNHYRLPVMSDDSGLNIKACPQIMGVHSASFGGENLTDQARCIKLLDHLKMEKDRSSSFQCTLCFYLSPREIYYFEGKVDGLIGYEQRGRGGFGYDTIFYPEQYPRHTIAEVSHLKDLFSHRSKALFYAKEFFKFYCQKQSFSI